MNTCAARVRSGNKCKWQATHNIPIGVDGLDVCEMHESLYHDVEQKRGPDVAAQRIIEGGVFQYAVR